VKFYKIALVGVIIKVILQNARCNNKDRNENVFSASRVVSRGRTDRQTDRRRDMYAEGNNRFFFFLKWRIRLNIARTRVKIRSKAMGI